MTPQIPVLFVNYDYSDNIKEVVFAKDQPEYLQLPAIKLPDGQVITRWNFTLKERIKILFSGNLWLSLLTFNNPLQPIQLWVDEPTIGRFD